MGEQTRWIHKWTEEERTKLSDAVAILQPKFAEARERGMPETNVWNMVPGMLGLLVSGHSCFQQWRNIQKLEAIKAEAAEKGAVQKVTEERPAVQGTDLAPLLGMMKQLNTLVFTLGGLLEAQNKKTDLLTKQIEQISASLQTSLGNGDLYLEKISAQFDALLTELRKAA